MTFSNESVPLTSVFTCWWYYAIFRH